MDHICKKKKNETYKKETTRIINWYVIVDPYIGTRSSGFFIFVIFPVIYIFAQIILLPTGYNDGRTYTTAAGSCRCIYYIFFYNTLANRFRFIIFIDLHTYYTISSGRRININFFFLHILTNLVPHPAVSTQSMVDCPICVYDASCFLGRAGRTRTTRTSWGTRTRRSNGGKLNESRYCYY